MYELCNIPSHSRCTNCGSCCTLVPANDAEIKAIRKYISTRKEVRDLAVRQSCITYCLFRDMQKRRCAIYQVRPMLCRLMGVCTGMECNNGNSSMMDASPFMTEHTFENTRLLNTEDWRNDHVSQNRKRDLPAFRPVAF